MAESIHPEDALFNAGASDGYYEIVGASYAPADTATGTPAAATIDLSTMDQTGCLLPHNYETAETTLRWDADALYTGPTMYGTADDIQIAVEDITRGQLEHLALFEAFRAQITGTARSAELSTS